MTNLLGAFFIGYCGKCDASTRHDVQRLVGPGPSEGRVVEGKCRACRRRRTGMLPPDEAGWAKVHARREAARKEQG